MKTPEADAAEWLPVYPEPEAGGVLRLFLSLLDPPSPVGSYRVVDTQALEPTEAPCLAGE